MKKQRKKTQLYVYTALGVLVLVIFLSILGLSKSVSDISEEAISKTPEAVLASKGLDEDASISLPVAYFDQKSDECVNLYDIAVSSELYSRQFEWASCNYTNRDIEQGMVDYYLGEDYLPVAKGGKLVSNRGLTDMARWFNPIEGKSKEYIGNIKLDYKADRGAEFSYSSNDFYPVDEFKFSEGDEVNHDGHNHLFTMSFALPFTVGLNGEESFEITADDDTFVYFGNELVLDMGGIHGPITGKITIDENGEVNSAIFDEELAYAGINVSEGDNVAIRVYHADRDSVESVFRIKTHEMSLTVMEAKIAGGEMGTQVAFDPSDPMYVAPLGETSIFRPDGTRGYIIMATVMGALIVVFSIFVAILMRDVVKGKVKK
ncbi:hypothetical protein IJH72_01100 [Candidatus Saccharibacteria bacterium]|nr:hypothetical protein [Candidatus Saccharibacteria bacterium]